MHRYYRLIKSDMEYTFWNDKYTWTKIKNSEMENQRRKKVKLEFGEYSHNPKTCKRIRLHKNNECWWIYRNGIDALAKELRYPDKNLSINSKWYIKGGWIFTIYHIPHKILQCSLRIYLK